MVYRSVDDFVAEAVAFIRDGLAHGDAIVLATPRAQAVVAALGGDAGALEVVDDLDWHRVPARAIGGYAGRARRAGRGGRRVRALTELRWNTGTLTAADRHRMRYESILNQALSGLAVDLCCAFDATALPDEVLAEVPATHPRVLPAGGRDGAEIPGHYVDPAEYLIKTPDPILPLTPAPGSATEVRFGAADIPAIRRTALSWARAAGLPEDDAQDLLIAVYEVATNAVEHGGGAGIGRFWSVGPTLYCEVWSARPLADPLAGYRPPGSSQQRGRGLWLARQICDEVAIGPDGGGTLVRLATGAQALGRAV